MTDESTAQSSAIRQADLKVVKRLGSGAFGNVDLCIWKINSTKVAVKSMRTDAKRAKSKNEDEEFEKEQKLLKEFPHPNVVQLLGWQLENEPKFFVTEVCVLCQLRLVYSLCCRVQFMEMGDLENALACKTSQFRWGAKGHRVARDICRGLSFLHGYNITHFDLKPGAYRNEGS
jgi:serine/threonine protein kinase